MSKLQSMQSELDCHDEKDNITPTIAVDWHKLREQENQALQSIKKLDDDGTTNVEQWLLILHHTFEELQYPVMHRVLQATTYFNDEYNAWYDRAKNEINNNWTCFSEHFKLYVQNRSQQSTDSFKKSHRQQHLDTGYSLEDLINTEFTKFSGGHNAEDWLLQTIKQFKRCALNRNEQFMSLPLLLDDQAYLWYTKQDGSIQTFETFCKLFLTQFSPPIVDKELPDIAGTVTVSPDTIQTFVMASKSAPSTHLQQTVADDIIKKPSYFRGAKDDVQDWLEKIEQRFGMAKWDDQQKLQYISIHLQDDAYRWWLQAAESITSWPNFVQSIKTNFGSTQATEIAFEQLKWYKQTLNQTVSQYHDKTMELCKRVDPAMSDAMKLKYLMAGVRESLKLHISLHDPKTPHAFLSFARKVEDASSLNNIHQELPQRTLNTNRNSEYSSSNSFNTSSFSPSYHQPTPHPLSQQLQPQSSYENHNNVQSKGSNARYYNRSRYSLHQPKSNACYKCGTPGHYARDCTRRPF